MGNCYSTKKIIKEETDATPTNIEDVFTIADSIVGGSSYKGKRKYGIISEWSYGWIVPGKIYDGDTMTFGTKVLYAPDCRVFTAIPPKHVLEFDFKVRLFGYDAPEMKPSRKLTEEQRNHCKELANLARDKLIELCEPIPVKSKNPNEQGKIMFRPLPCVFVGPVCDKYGRILCVVYNHNGENINREMLKLPYCKPYDGGRKQ